MKIAKLLFLISVVLLLSVAYAAEMEKGTVKITQENATALAINYAKVNLKASNNVTLVNIELQSGQKIYRVTLTDNINEYILNVDSTTGAVSTVAVRPVEAKEVKPEGTEEKTKEVKEEKAEEKEKEVKEEEAEKKKKEEREEEEREKKNMRFARTGDTFNGKFVSFQISDGNILNYTFGGELIFKSISLGFTPRIKAEGSEVELTAGEKEEKTEVKIHDNPNGLMTIETEGKLNLTFTLAVGAEVKQSKVELTGVNASIRRVGEEGMVNFTLSGSTLKASLDHGKIMFKAVPLTAKTEKEKEFEDEIEEGIAHKKIGAVVSIEKSESHDEISLDDVKVVVNTVKNNTVSVNVSSSLTEGKTVVIRINNDILAAVNPRDVKVKFDDEDIQQADNYADVIDIKSDKPKYLIVIGAKDVEALVSIPKFSEHQITFTTTPKAPGFTALLGALALVFAARYLVRRK